MILIVISLDVLKGTNTKATYILSVLSYTKVVVAAADGAVSVV